jgi:hypothetical protein
MDITIVRHAVEQLQTQGIALDTITAPQVRELTGVGSYSTILAHLRTIRNETPTDREGDADELSVHAETGLALPEPDAADPVQAAEQAVARAQQQVDAIEAEFPKVDAYLAEARREVFVKAQAHLVASYSASKGLIGSADPLIRHAEEEMFAAGRLLKQLIEMHDALPAQLKQAQAGLRLAAQHLWLTRARPDLLAALAATQTEPVPDPGSPDAYRQYQARKARLTQAREACDAAIAQAGL